MEVDPTLPLNTEDLTTPFMKRMYTPALQEEVNVAVIASVIAVVFITLLTVLVVIIVYLYKNKGTYLTYEQSNTEPDVSVQMENVPPKEEKEEYFI